MDYYKLVNKLPVPCSLLEWAATYGMKKDKNRVIKQERHRIKGKKVFISTVFLGLDHAWGHGSRPILFETMIFGGKYSEYQDRCCTYEEAEDMHEKAVNLVLSDKQIFYKEWWWEIKRFIGDMTLKICQLFAL